MERADGSVVSNCLSFKATGRISGGGSRNEARWAFKRGKLHIFGLNGQTTTYFHTERVDGGGYLLIGKYRGNKDPNWHLLREIPGSSQTEAFEAVVAKAEAAGPAGRDYFDFLLRILEPRAVDPEWRSLRVVELADLEPKGPHWRRLSPSFSAQIDTPAIFEFDDAELLPHGGFVFGEMAIDEFLFCTQPNWREIGLAPIVANQTPIAHFDVGSECAYLERGACAERVGGPHFWLGAPFALINFGHFIHDLATQLIHVDRAKLIYGPRLKFVLTSFLASSFRYPTQELLFREFFGPIEDVVFHRGGRLEIETLCAGSPVFWPKRGQPEGVSRAALRHLSRRVRERFANLRQPRSGRRIYITRNDGRNIRHLENEAEVRAILVERGFEPITISELEPLAVVEKFSNAAAVVGAHGAGLMNVVFCDPDEVRMLELDVFPPAWSSVAAFARGLGVDYCKIPAAPGSLGNSRGVTEIEALQSELDRLRIF